MEIRVSGMVNDSIVDGRGIRFTVFTQGCTHNCKGCHNPQTHPVDGGKVYDTGEVIAKFRRNPLLDGITLSGGEPFLQSAACAELAKAAHRWGLDVWTYSGYTFETLLTLGGAALELLRETDVLVDGPFVEEERSLELRFRGSRNQRIIDVKASLAEGRAVLWRDLSERVAC